MVAIQHSQGTRDNVTDAARSILQDCIWEDAASSILKYDAPHPRVKEIPEFSDWLRVMKVTGGVIAIGWYDSDVDKVVEFTVLDVGTDKNNPLKQVNAAVSRLGILRKEDLPSYQTGGHQSIHDSLDSDYLATICVTINEVRESIPVDDRADFPLNLSRQRSINMFDHDYTPEGHWDEITEYIPVTDPAVEVIKRVPWADPRDAFLSYATTTDPGSFIPDAHQWLKIMKQTAGQIITAWYDPDYNTINQITYYELRENGEFRFFTTTTDLSDKTSIHQFKETLTDSRLIPTALSIHGLDMNEFK